MGCYLKTGLQFQLSNEVSLDLTCTIDTFGEACTANTAKEITYKVATIKYRNIKISWK